MVAKGVDTGVLGSFWELISVGQPVGRLCMHTEVAYFQEIHVNKSYNVCLTDGGYFFGMSLLPLQLA